MTKEEIIRRRIGELPASMSQGQRALESLDMYLSHGVPVPVDVLRKINGCYRYFREGKPVCYMVEQEFAIPSPLTLGEAFGVLDKRGGSTAALKRKRLALATPRLVALFTGQVAQRLPRTKEGYATAAIKLRLTASEVEDWVARYAVSKRIKVQQRQP